MHIGACKLFKVVHNKCVHLEKHYVFICQRAIVIRVDMKIKVKKVYFAPIGQNEKENIGASDNPLLCIAGVKKLSKKEYVYISPFIHEIWAFYCLLSTICKRVPYKELLWLQISLMSCTELYFSYDYFI